ncbi:pyruvate dehydrogenase (acetyl-transferring), homodimeric type [Paraconexibacter antarcticus]|uniref:Pyruvate dehydrogenase E1 component n=1 Tax=Paraconexibacter antarcticus TaxID=2949664 RepID=A0ABY5DVH5_9ACTN|nr:pyruvate dehydrogenase (acetyl-transferring), homodimeric type [Paraconexibacter antarcticus]UTI65485.1 pyruvate dehydrogenase (acetyl-transferring), homodimeric type [Paraconexibacter antarcticus]
MTPSDVDPQETREWLEALDAVARESGPDRAREILDHLLALSSRLGAHPHTEGPTPYVNTIAVDQEEQLPGDPAVERALRSLVRWNAMELVLQANKESSELGGHIASFQSAAVLYETGFNHFWRAPTDENGGGDLVYIQGHSSPGIYARAFLEGRFDEEQLRRFRRETDAGKPGLSSYPHPWLMPGFWQFPTVSMGLGPLMAIYQARFMKYLKGRDLGRPSGRKVWAFMGDGEMDEPESMGAISLAGREKLDNLIFVINCNLQRLDGPVRGNGKIIQELETNFRGAGWNVIKVIWGSKWDPLLAADTDGRLVRRMEEAVDGDYQTYKSRNGAYVREHFFGKDPQLLKMVEHMSDEEVWALNRGGHDPQKVYAAYAAASKHSGQPTVILAKTIKGYGMGTSGEGQNITHQQKKMTRDSIRAFRTRFDLPITDERIDDTAFVKPSDDDPAMVYLQEHRKALGGYLPQRRPTTEVLPVPELSAFHGQLEGSGEREISTTMAFVRVLATLVRDKQLGRRVVPIVPDESRTFGMEGMFRQLGIFSQVGQLYSPEDSEQLMFYREDKHGQILQEGINEPGAMSSWIAAATSYANHGVAMIPFYIYYSMFGFQRVGDLAYAAGDSRARGFLIGGTAGRTTLNGEGLQHEDGHSHLLASTIPNCVAYDPTYGYEVAVIVQDGLRRMVAEHEDVFFYLTVMNENYVQPPMPEGAEADILKGLHRIAGDGNGAIRLLGSGTILREVEAAAAVLKEDHGIDADVFSATSFNELRRDGMATERWNRLHPTEPPRVSHVGTTLPGDAPVVAASDYMRAFADQIRPYVDAPYTVLGTDGFGRSDYRRALRSFFEVDRRHVVVAALHALGRREDAAQAISAYDIDPEAVAPWRR